MHSRRTASGADDSRRVSTSKCFALVSRGAVTNTPESNTYFDLTEGQGLTWGQFEGEAKLASQTPSAAERLTLANSRRGRADSPGREWSSRSNSNSRARRVRSGPFELRSANGTPALCRPVCARVRSVRVRRSDAIDTSPAIDFVKLIVMRN